MSGPRKLTQHDLTNEAKERLLEMLCSSNYYVSVMAALEILDRAFGDRGQWSTSEFAELAADLEDEYSKLH